MQDSEAAAGATANDIETTVTATHMGRSLAGVAWNVACQFRNEIEANYIRKFRRCEKIQKKSLLQSQASQLLHCNHTLTFGLLSGLFVNTSNAAIFCRKFSRSLAQ
jgi:hypothetical protein